MKNASWKITLAEITLLLLFSLFLVVVVVGGGAKLAEC